MRAHEFTTQKKAVSEDASAGATGSASVATVAAPLFTAPIKRVTKNKKRAK